MHPHRQQHAQTPRGAVTTVAPPFPRITDAPRVGSYADDFTPLSDGPNDDDDDDDFAPQLEAGLTRESA